MVGHTNTETSTRRHPMGSLQVSAGHLRLGLHQDRGRCGQGSYVGDLCAEAVGHRRGIYQDVLREAHLSACDPRRFADSGGYSVTRM